VQKFESNSCNLGNFTVILDESRAIFAHVNTPLLGYLVNKGGYNITIMPVVANPPVVEGYNPYFGIGKKKTGEVSYGPTQQYVYEYKIYIKHTSKFH
jgi:hypothetical protein